MKTSKTMGRRFSRRVVEVFTTPCGEIELQQIDWGGRISPGQFPKLKADALNTLRKQGFDVEQSLSTSPHGSLLRNEVLLDHEPDSFPGLAAQIFERIAHIESYSKMDGATATIIGLSVELGSLAKLYAVYKSESLELSAISKKPKKKKAIRSAIIEVMGAGKSSQQSFKSFMQMWELGHLEGLTLAYLKGGKYRITDENGDADPEEYTIGSLQKMYAQQN